MPKQDLALLYLKSLEPNPFTQDILLQETIAPGVAVELARDPYGGMTGDGFYGVVLAVVTPAFRGGAGMEHNSLESFTNEEDALGYIETLKECYEIPENLLPR
jgi:hypothetical protein